jgi:hypothetical protein
MDEANWLASTDPGAMLAAVRWDERRTPPHLVSDRKLRLFACGCCRLAWPLLADPRSRAAVETAERFADGMASEEELDAAGQEATYAARGEENTPLFAPPWVADRRRFLLAAERLRSQNGPQFDRKAGLAQAALLRDIVGSPFRPVTLKWDGDKLCEVKYAHHGMSSKLSEYLDPVRWLMPTALALAEAAYSEPRRVGCGRCGGAKVICEQGQDYGPGPERRCPACSGAGTTTDGLLDGDRLVILADALEDAGCADAALLAHLRDPGPHAKGCHVVDLLLGKE